MNKVIFTGNLARDPEIRRTQDGKAVTSNAVAVNRLSKNPDGSRKVDFIPFTAFDQRAEFLVNYVKKGDRVEITGRWEIREYTDKDGIKRREGECVVESLDAISKPKPKEEPKQTNDIDSRNVYDDDLPF